ncbi:phage tail tube protein [Roseomonas xinghualingensis]|uniref:phage tail tube protein n=1 Tax=Roseomonas xinghualingensis TaxID=2986475 RepID=UPI0021F17B20|nr:phage tail tube protein [Roseomonas sp. SXEYE001]MCV4209897.1 phage tail tube protein [Roseomonas sp. SXEYE001]
MVATTAYQAGVESSLAQIGYIQETAWGVLPASPQLKRIRYTGESLSGSKTRQRPNEIRGDRQASAAVTTEETAGGSINFALSYGTFDDILSGVMGGEWTTNVLKPGTIFKSFLIEKLFSSALALRYPGSFFTSASLTMARGQFLSGSFNVLAKEEMNFTASASTAAYTAAPTGRVMDPVTGVKDVMLDGSALATGCNSITLNITNDGAGADYALGSASAQGMRMGLLTVGGSAEFYFRDFTLYQRFKSETSGAFSWRTVDAAGNAYRFTIPDCILTNPRITAGGVNQPVMCMVDLEGNPHPTNGSVMIERIPAT